MKYNLKNIIDNLKQSGSINSDPHLIGILNSINKYGENDYSRAWLLGLFFKNKFYLADLPPTEKNKLIHFINENRLGNYFYLKEKPREDTLGIVIYIFLSGGILLLIVGVLDLINHKYSFVEGVRFPAPMI